MRRVLLIFLSLVLALASAGAAGAEDGFYVIPAMKGNYAPVPKTGQTTVYVPGDDGDLHKGVAWPTPRFTDNQNGTVTDNLTGLIWLQNASALGPTTWGQAITIANNLKSGDAGLKDGSTQGNWRLPNIRELQSLVDYGRGGEFTGPAVPTPNPFIGVVWQNRYWSSTSENGSLPNLAWWVGFDLGFAGTDPKSNNYLVWCVRGGR
ncbi:MAG: DUF1566 domain-containing protein [Desulfobacterales bacterium]|nr:DUF1566 domain-containing protein [Pseudomonadota bacterium]MBU4357526.1 DUF1566 domain-containing protein [Pseudomonadota bacterium]MCG2772359.1 DUF1566 domain-containing protein [Desulfobacterales bacterium]